MDVGGDQVDTRSRSLNDIFSPEPEETIFVPTKKDDVFYKTDHKRRGIAVIFNHENFLTGDDPRIGTDKDCADLAKTLEEIGFEVRKFKDLTVEGVMTQLKNLSQEDFSDCDCLFIAVMSHGQKNLIVAKDYAYPHNVLFEPFTPHKCPTLAGKPKLYMIQTCQGNDYHTAVNVNTSVEVDSSYSIPLYADILVAHSTIPGFISWRHPERGTWFIQALCAELRAHWKDTDFLTILTYVNSRVACGKITDVPDKPWKHKKKQMPSFTSMLTRVLKFHPKPLDLKQNGTCNDV